MKNKNKFNRKLVFIIIIFLLIIGLAFFMIKPNNINSKVISDEKSFSEDFFSGDNCRCFERERLKCSGEFELDEERRLCVSEKDITNVLLSCSKYECSGQVYSFNFDTKKWETKE
tara:strand:- start:1800 stop:2144 length:345 start_codon:yes stop_codon:yes gene_type:complete